jgi:anion-transporting  ArsA/GET3 family ATPase
MMRDLLAKPLVVVTGKGGVGKSTVAAALAVAAAAAGRRTIVAEVAARDDVSRMAAGDDGAGGRGGRVRFPERAVAEGLHHISIDPEAALEEYLRDQLPRGVADVLAASRSFGYLTAATPGLRELLTIGKVWELAQPDRRTPGAHPYDLVVLDAPATGHGVAVLQAPGTFAGAARMGPIARQGGMIHGMVADPEQTAIVAVSTPEEMPVNETLALQAALAEGLGQRLAAVVVNGMLPRRFARLDLDKLDGASSRAARAVRMQATRSTAQQAQLARLRRGVGTPVRTLPFVFAPSLGPAEVRRLAGDLVR